MRDCKGGASQRASVLRLAASMAAAVLAGAVMMGGGSAIAQKPGGTLRIYNTTQPPSASIHEESTIATNMPFMAVFNNLVRFDSKKPRNSFDTIVPELAESWKWDDTGTKLSFTLRSGVKWHDGKPFTAKDVQCTWNRVSGLEKDYLRRSPRLIWFENLKEITVESDTAVTFHLTKPQPSLIAMLASGLSPVYPCHLTARDMRTKPIGTGPFKFVEFKSNESIKLAKNPDYWDKGKPYLDGVEFRIVTSRATRVLAFVAGEFDLTFVADITVPLMGQVAAQAPQAQCSLVPTNVPINLLVNAQRPPFDNPQVRKAMALAIDRPSLIEIISGGKASVASNMMALPEGQWGMPAEMMAKLPGYGNVAEQQAEARKIMESLGYGPNNRLKVKVATRDFSTYKDPAVVFVDQLNKIHFDAEMELVESSIWHSRLVKKDYSVGMNTSGVGIDDPDAVLKGAYACKSEANYTGYCNPETEKLLDAQSQERDIEKRRKIVWEIEKKLTEEVARPILYHNRAATCWHPHLKNYVHQENSIYNNWRFDDVWLDK
jgi:peptide/nickel transport system substrate-binding protein